MATSTINNGQLASHANVTATQSKAVYYWASYGALWLVFALYVCISWLMSTEHFAPVPLTEADALTVSQQAMLRLVEAVSFLVAAFTISRYIVEPLREGKAIGLEGMLVIGAVFAYCWDTTINYYDYLMAWNKHSINFGTWGAFWPGHEGPTNYAEALFWGPPMYLYFGVGLGGLQWLGIKYLERRYQMGLVLAIAITFVGAFLFDIIAESIIIRAGAYAWPKTIPALTLWSGSQYQFPLYEAFLVAMYATAYAMLLRSKEFHGFSFIERGAENLSGWMQFILRLLAAIGFASVIAGLYFIGFLVISLGAGEAIPLPEYLMYVAS